MHSYRLMGERSNKNSERFLERAVLSSGEEVVNNVAVNVGKAEVAAGVVVGETFVVEA